MIPCICINDKGMPSDFPNKNKWIKEGITYKIIRVLFITQSNTLGVELNEIDLQEDCYPYLYFRLDRFAIPMEYLADFENLVRACKEEQEVNVDINSLMEKVLTLEEVY